MQSVLVFLKPLNADESENLVEFRVLIFCFHSPKPRDIFDFNYNARLQFLQHLN